MLYRWLVLGVLILAYMVVFFHRLAAGVVRADLSKEFGMSGVTFANLSSIYFYAYTVMQVPSGIFADTIGARKTVTGGTFLAGLGSILFGYANSIFLIFLGRLLVGLGVSVVFIAILKIQSKWFKESEFGTLSGITSFFGNIGGTFAQTPLALLVAAITWRYSFIFIGFVTIIISALCYIFVRDTPSDLGLPELEKSVDKIGINGLHCEVNLAESMRIVIFNRWTWYAVFIFTGFFATFTSLTGTWGVSYLTSVYGFSKIKASNYIVVAVLGLAIGSIVIGRLSDKIKKRKLPMAIFGSIYIICWILIVFWDGGKLPVVALMPLLFILGFSCSAYVLTWACSKEVNPPEIAGMSTSMVNIGGFLGAAILPPIMGMVIDRLQNNISPIELYQKAFMYCFILSLAGFLFTFLIKETYCKNIYKVG